MKRDWTGKPHKAGHWRKVRVTGVIDPNYTTQLRDYLVLQGMLKPRSIGASVLVMDEEYKK